MREPREPREPQEPRDLRDLRDPQELRDPCARPWGADVKNGSVTRASLDKQPSEVAAMFDGVAAKYDLTNDVLSLGQARLWRKAVARALAVRPGERVLDLGAGTGTSSLLFAAAGARVVPCDFSIGMLREGKRRHPFLPLTAGD